ncbi:MAG: hypothetical protein A2Y25_02760 [Candidatus Melainabacteria bacterium GWF2_37_15]|nr:MAG: hypothetical protein A2Y25_02760 [Candidatus Melainabacteria bacterium GWF2_37_15]
MEKLQVNLTMPQFSEKTKKRAIVAGEVAAVGLGAMAVDKMVRSEKVLSFAHNLATKKYSIKMLDAASTAKSGLTKATKYLASKPVIKQMVKGAGMAKELVLKATPQLKTIKIAAGIAAALLVANHLRTKESEQN